MKIKKGDNVVILSGKDKGKTGKVEKVFAKKGQVLVEGLNIIVKHQKSRRAGSTGQVIKKSAPINASNVAVQEGKKAVRVGYKMEDGKKVRISRQSGKNI